MIFHCLAWTAIISTAQQDATKSLLEDPELLNALEIFMGMSAQERYETIQGLMEAVGHDPDKRLEMERLIEMLPQMEDNSDLKEMIRQDELLKAKQQAKRQLDGQDWESFWAMQADILEATIASGQLTPEQAAHFKTDEEAWKAQLRTIFNDLHGNGKDEL